MEKQEKKTKVSGVYLVLAALTVLFAVSLLHGGVNLGWYAMLSAIRQD